MRGSTTSTLTPSAFELVRRAERMGHKRAESDDGDIRSLAGDSSHAELDPVPLLRNGRGLAEEEELLLEEDDRVVAADRRRQQSLRVVRGGGHRDDEARDVREQRLEALRVLGAEPDATP